MATSESFRGNVPAALEELRQHRSGGCLVWFFELLWAYCPESRGLKGTDAQPGLMHPSSDDDQSVLSGTNTLNNSNNSKNAAEGPKLSPDQQMAAMLWKLSSNAINNSYGSTSNNHNNNNINSTSVFGTWEEDQDEIDTAEKDQPHDDYLWLPVLPPTVLLNFSRIQSWYFTPRTRMQMQREIAFFSVADEDDKAKMRKHLQEEGGSTSEAQQQQHQNELDKLLAKYHEKERLNKKKRDLGVKKLLQTANHHTNNVTKGREAQAALLQLSTSLDDHDQQQQLQRSGSGERDDENDDETSSNHQNALEILSGAGGGGGSSMSAILVMNKSSRQQQQQRRRKSTIFENDLPEPEKQPTLGQRQIFGIRAIAERYKREHSSNADELPAPVLKRLRGRLSTAVIVDAFEREYIQGLKVDNVTSHGLAMAQAERDKKSSISANSPLAQLASLEAEDGKKKKRNTQVRHYPAGWMCPEGPEQKELQYDRIVAQLIRKSAVDPAASHYHHQHSRNSSHHNNSNRSKSAMMMMNDDDDSTIHNDDGDDSHHHHANNNSNNSPSISGFKTSKSNRSLPSAAKTAELLSQSLCSPTVEYLTIESLRRVLCSGTLGQAALLQQFVPPPPPTAVGNARFNETLDFRWQPRWRYLERCTNSHALDDWTVPANKRGPTFEGPPGTSVGAMLGQATLYRLERACRAIVRHVFNVSQFTARILRLHCIFKFDEKLTLVLCCVVEAYSINPRAIPPCTSIANILNADAHLPRIRTTAAATKQQEQQQQFQLAQQQQQQFLATQTRLNNNNNNATEGSSPTTPGRSNLGSHLDSPSNQNNHNNKDNKVEALPTAQERRIYLQQRQQQNNLWKASASIEENVTSTGWEAIKLDIDDVRSSPIRAVAAMSRGEARTAAIRKTMMERVAGVQAKKEMRMISDTQGVVKPIEQLRKEADAAFAAMNPKAAKALDALFSRRDRRRALLRAGNESAFDDQQQQLRDRRTSSSPSLTNNNDYGSSLNNNHFPVGSGASAAKGGVKRNRTTNQFNEASETIDDLLWGRQSQLARALLRPVASRDDASKLPFHRRPARSLAAECGASGVGDRYIRTMRSASTPDPNSGIIVKPNASEIQHRRAFF